MSLKSLKSSRKGTKMPTGAAKRLKYVPVWTTKDKREIPISEMEDNHILNCIKMLEAKGEQWREIEANSLIRGLTFINGEMAQMALESELDNLMDRDLDDLLPEVYSDLINEAEKRGLKL